MLLVGFECIPFYSIDHQVRIGIDVFYVFLNCVVKIDSENDKKYNNNLLILDQGKMLSRIFELGKTFKYEGERFKVIVCMKCVMFDIVCSCGCCLLMKWCC